MRLHKQVYLAGLYLCVLSPGLCKLLAGNLLPGNITAAFMDFALESNGLRSAASASQDAQAVDYDELAQAVSNRLEQGEQLGDTVANRIIAQLAPTLQNGEKAAEEAAVSSNDVEFLRTQLTLLSQQMQEQTRIIREQSRLLNSLASAGFSNRAAPAQGDGNAAAAPMENLSSTAANVRKVRSKGVF